MSTQYAVFNSKKGKGSGSGLGYHIDRIEGKDESYTNADSSRKNLNINYPILKKDENGNTVDVSKLPLDQAINYRIKEGYTKPIAIRKDAVKYLAHILTGSPEQMKVISKDKALFNKWIATNKQFIEEQFGKDNLVRFTLHMDETTPHLHAITIPITKEGGLSAKSCYGGKGLLRYRQDRYAELMKPFGLERGEKREKTNSKDLQVFYGEINAIRKEFNLLPEELPTKGFLESKEEFKHKRQEALDNALRNFVAKHNLTSHKATITKNEALAANQKFGKANTDLKEKVAALQSEGRKKDAAIQKLKEDIKKESNTSFNQGAQRVLKDINANLKHKGYGRVYGYNENGLTVTQNTNNKNRGPKI